MRRIGHRFVSNRRHVLVRVSEVSIRTEARRGVLTGLIDYAEAVFEDSPSTYQVQRGLFGDWYFGGKGFRRKNPKNTSSRNGLGIWYQGDPSAKTPILQLPISLAVANQDQCHHTVCKEGLPLSITAIRAP